MENIKQEPDSTPSATNTDGTKTERRRKRRWGSAAAPETATSSATTATILTAATTTSTTTTSSAGPVDSKAKALALKASIAARLAALKSRTAAATAFVPTSNVNVNSNSNSNSNSSKRPLPQSTAAASSARASSAAPGPPSTKRAKHYELDMTVTGPTFAKAASLLPAKPKPKANPYLAHREAQSDDTATATADNTQTVTFSDASSKYVDARLEAAGHTTGQQHRQRHRRELRFVEPGTFVDIAERKRQRAANAASAGFASGRKAGQYFRSATMGSNYYGTTEVLDEMEDKGIMSPRAEIGNVDVSKRGKQQQQQQQQQPLRAMPTVVEWWDMELLPSKLRRQVASYEGKALSKATQSHMQLRQPAAMAAAAVAVKTENDGAGTQSAAAIAAATTTTTTTTTIETETEPKTVDRALELRTKCSQQASLSHSKTAGLVQHIVPIQPPGDTGKKPSEPVLYLTKKEQKRARKRRREQKQRELQDLQAAGLIEPPEPRLTLQNFIRVMGDQAYVDPSQMEQKVMEQVQKRQRAHLERNEAKKLSREQKAEKLRNKVLRDANPTANATGAIHVALFFVKNASHPYHRTKIDLNAQQLNITGGVVECDFPSLACVVCEGGPKAIQKYTRLMMVRMKWKGPDGEEEDDDEIESDDNDQDNDNDNPVLGPDGLPLPNKKPKKHRFDRDNHCALVWTGMVPKRQFAGFVFQHCETSAQARKVLGSRGVGQYWNQVLAHASGSGETMRLKLVDSDDDDDDNEKDENDNDNDNEKDDDQDDNHADADAMDVDVDVDVEPTEA